MEKDLHPNPRLPDPARRLQKGDANPTDLSAEATAGRILGGIQGFIYGGWRLGHPDMTEEDFAQFETEVMKGLERGLSEAREILTALGTVDERLAVDVAETERLVREGLDEFFSQERAQFASGAYPLSERTWCCGSTVDLIWLPV